MNPVPLHENEPTAPLPHPDPRLVDSSAPVIIPTPHGKFEMQAWAFADGTEHMSLRAVDDHGEPIGAQGEVPAVRVHSECATGDLFGSFRCDCGPQLAQGLDIIQSIGGYLIYARNHEGRGIGLVNKLRAYALQDEGLDTFDANLHLGLEPEMRDYRQVAVILRQLGLDRISLVSNNPDKAEGLRLAGIEVTELVPDQVPPRPENLRYLQTKQNRMHHHLHFDI